MAPAGLGGDRTGAYLGVRGWFGLGGLDSDTVQGNPVLRGGGANGVEALAGDGVALLPALHRADGDPQLRRHGPDAAEFFDQPRRWNVTLRAVAVRRLGRCPWFTVGHDAHLQSVPSRQPQPSTLYAYRKGERTLAYVRGEYTDGLICQECEQRLFGRVRGDAYVRQRQSVQCVGDRGAEAYRGHAITC